MVRLSDVLEGFVRTAGFTDIRCLKYTWHLGLSGSHLGADFVRHSFDNFKALVGPDGPIATAAVRAERELGTAVAPDVGEVKQNLEEVLSEVERFGASFTNVFVVGRTSL